MKSDQEKTAHQESYSSGHSKDKCVSYSFIHSFDEHLPNIYLIVGTLSWAKDMTMKKTEIPSLVKLTLEWEKKIHSVNIF